MSILRLAIPSPLRASFDYLPPVGTGEELLNRLQPGCRVTVPFGRREATGILLEVLATTDYDPGKLRQATDILDPASLLNSRLVELCAWASSYYHHPAGEVFAAAFPATLRKGGPHRLLGQRGWRLSARGKGLPRGSLGRSPRQAEALALLQENAAVGADEFKQQGITPAIMRALLDKGLVEACTIKPEKARAKAAPGLNLNPEQQLALEAMIGSLDGFHCHLLEGVTGSGKTEVYLQLIARCLEQGQQALVLVPEIGLTPQTLGRFQQRFQATIVSMHSGLAEGERYKAWESARDGSADIVIGTRSSIFAPLDRLGLIIIDEEHDASYKQQDGFRYSARDIAVKRGQLEQCPVVLGSATPSLESIHNANSGRYQHHQLLERAGGASMPTLQAIDIRKQALTAGFSDALLESIADALAQKQQVLLFLNRRGYAPTLICHDCGWLAQCRHCDARMTLHRRQGKLRCHHCTAAAPAPRACPECHSSALMTAGLGTEQADDFLRTRFGEYPLHRVDSDSMQGKGAMQALADEIESGEPCILLGTQMLTKGHHFPAVNLVAVIDSDAALFSADFRGEERMAQLLTQVAGRAGRAGQPGRVLLQTHYPDHPTLQAFLQQPYATHARQILEQRLTTGLPPAAYMALVRTDSTRLEDGEQFLQQLRQICQGALPAGASLLGPLPAPLQRRAGKFRCQLLLSANSRGAAQAASAQLVAGAESLPGRSKLNWSIDIDPQDSF